MVGGRGDGGRGDGVRVCRPVDEGCEEGCVSEINVSHRQSNGPR